MTAQEENDRLIFIITDNGVGFASDETAAEGSGLLGHVGLRNVDARLKLYYGQEYGLTIHSAPGDGCTVRLMVGKQLLNRKA